MRYYGSEMMATQMRVVKRSLGYGAVSAFMLTLMGSFAVVATLLYAPEYTLYLGVAIAGLVAHTTGLIIRDVENGDIPPLGESDVEMSALTGTARLVVLTAYFSTVFAGTVGAMAILAPPTPSWWLFAALYLPVLDNLLLRRTGYSPAAIPAIGVTVAFALLGLLDATVREILTDFDRRGGRLS